MNFFKQAQEFAASANTNTDGNNNTPATGSDGGFGSFMSQATNMLKSQGAAPANDGSQAPASLPGGRTAPTNAQLMQSGELLFGAAQGQKVDPTQLAGAASDLLGGLTAHGNLDQGTYGTYINQAENYLNKYSGQGQSGSAAGGAPPATQVPNSQAPPSNQTANAPPRGTSDQTANYQSPADQTADYQSPADQTADYQSPADQTADYQSSADQTADSGSMNAPSTDDYAPDQQQGARPPSSAYDNNQY